MLSDIFHTSPITAILMSLSIIMFSGFFLTQITRALKLPDVTGYLFAGILMGPFVLDVIPAEIIEGLEFIADIAIGLIAFGVGKYLVFNKNEKNRYNAYLIALCEFVLTFALMFTAMYFIFKFSFSISFLISTIACATAPASTIMTIKQYKAKGPFVNTLLKVIAFDNAIAIILFHICLMFVKSPEGASLTFYSVLIPILQNVALIVLGIGLGFLVSFTLKKLKDSATKRLFVGLIAILLLISVCSYFVISPLLPCMAFGTAFINFKGNEELFENLNKFSPPIVLIFFMLSGIKFNIISIFSVGVIGLTYLIVRLIGKLLGSYIGGVVTKSPKNINNYLGFALIPQASVAISLVTIASRVIDNEIALTINVIILSAAFLYELIGPIAAKFSLFKAHSVHEKYLNKVVAPDYVEEPALQELEVINDLEYHSEENYNLDDESLFESENENLNCVVAENVQENTDSNEE